MKSKAFSVRLKEMRLISDKCFLVKAYDGSEAYIPCSQVYGQDPSRGNAWWISEWILDRKEIQYSKKKQRTFWVAKNGSPKMIPEITVEEHTPEPIEPKESQPDKSLVR